MQPTFETIRALKTRFVVIKNDSEEFILNVAEARLVDMQGPAELRFLNPSHTWASVWDDDSSEWRDVLGFQLPEKGEINEAFVKAVGNRLMLSFTDKKIPLLRWGFTAKDVEATFRK
ncbi:hypothetical protein GTP55_04575 [Duganella sp. FT109W]|uniref:Uncharacterized protein n=1 Tax=Duganella margarita TaxID=2692170 RepID=A0ABW9WDR9_9BURK|nr:hypothetical protein [Duganella margarita]MYN38642.1 hypothetical protein [Duganella margarita]